MAAIEEIAEGLEEAAVITRRITGQSVAFLVGGLVVGAAVGFYFGMRWNKEKIKAEAFEESEKEVEAIREAYRARAKLLTPKPSVEEIVEEKGYSELDKRPLRPPVPVQEPELGSLASIPAKSAVGVWRYDLELQNRVPDQPYVIHEDERHEKAGYSHVEYTYYAVDDVLVDDSDEKPVHNGHEIVGEGNLKFGYGSEDKDIVFVRNERLEIEMEICRVDRSYEADVLGLDGDSNEQD